MKRAEIWKSRHLLDSILHDSSDKIFAEVLRSIYERGNRRRRALTVDSMAALAIEMIDSLALFRGSYIHRNFPKIRRQQVFVLQKGRDIHRQHEHAAVGWIRRS